MSSALECSSNDRSRAAGADHADTKPWRCRHIQERRASLASGLVAAMKTWGQSWDEEARSFYGANDPYEHFTTSVQSGSLATALGPYLQLLLASSTELTIVDVGAGRGDLLVQLLALIPECRRGSVRLIALDLRQRPDELPAQIEWWQGDALDTCASIPTGPGLLIAHEFLDDLPCELVEVDEHGAIRAVMHEPSADAMILGKVLDAATHRAELDWIDKWWPALRPLMRVEVGIERDLAWEALTQWITSGLAIAIDYAHMRAERELGLWDGGTVAGYAKGRAVPPRLEQSMNLTAHVALDSVAMAASGRPLTQLRQCGPTPDFWWLVQTYGDLPQLT